MAKYFAVIWYVNWISFLLFEAHWSKSIFLKGHKWRSYIEKVQEEQSVYNECHYPPFSGDRKTLSTIVIHFKHMLNSLYSPFAFHVSMFSRNISTRLVLYRSMKFCKKETTSIKKKYLKRLKYCLAIIKNHKCYYFFFLCKSLFEEVGQVSIKWETK